MKQFITFTTLIFISALGFATEQDRRDIKNLSSQIHLAADITTASDANLKLAKDKLREVINLLNQTGGQPIQNQDCFDYAYSKYYSSQSTAQATDSAVAACKKIADLDVAKFVYDKNYISKNSKESMDEASNRSGYDLYGKLSMIQFAYNKYYISLSSVPAVTKATDSMRTVPAGSDQCLQKMYQKYYVSQSPVQAMDSAAKACSN